MLFVLMYNNYVIYVICFNNHYYMVSLSVELWNMAYGSLRISWVMVRNVKEEKWAWKGVSGWKKYLGLIPLAIFWMVRKERNIRVFEGVEEEFVWLQLDGFKLWVVDHGSSFVLYGERRNLIDILIDM